MKRTTFEAVADGKRALTLAELRAFVIDTAHLPADTPIKSHTSWNQQLRGVTVQGADGLPADPVEALEALYDQDQP